MPKHSLKPPTQQAQREKPLDAYTQRWLRSLEKLPFLDSPLVDGESDLIPLAIIEHFSVLLVLSRIGLPAQNAQRVHGVPASLLIAKYLQDYGWYPEHSRAEAAQLFLEEAETLRRSLHADLDLLSSPVEYAIALHKHGSLVSPKTGESGWLYCLDVASEIVRHELLECDVRYGTGGLYDLGRRLGLEDVAAVLGCSTESVCPLLESGQLVGSLEGPRSSAPEWIVSGHQLRTYVQHVHFQKLEKHEEPVRPADSGLHLVPEKATVAPSVPTDAC